MLTGYLRLSRLLVHTSNTEDDEYLRKNLQPLPPPAGTNTCERRRSRSSSAASLPDGNHAASVSTPPEYEHYCRYLWVPLSTCYLPVGTCYLHQQLRWLTADHAAALRVPSNLNLLF